MASPVGFGPVEWADLVPRLDPWEVAVAIDWLPDTELPVLLMELVVDAEDHLLGIITQDDVADILEDEATEDIERLGGSQPLEMPS